MGCDIHFFTERWTNNKNYDGPKDIQTERNNKLNNILKNDEYTYQEYSWVTADKWTNIVENGEQDYWNADEYYNDRNYFLFSILADVRNSYDIKPISEPRGIPDDCCFPIKYVTNLWHGDGHSHSYFTLKELIDVDWDSYCNCTNPKQPFNRTHWLDDFKLTLNKLKEIDSNPENVRCVFFFDN